MPDHLKIVPLRPRGDDGGEPPCNDIPTMLRQMADAVETGEYRGCTSMYVVVPQGGDFPLVFGWGDVTGRCAPLVQLELARSWFISQAFGSDGWRV